MDCRGAGAEGWGGGWEGGGAGVCESQLTPAGTAVSTSSGSQPSLANMPSGPIFSAWTNRTRLLILPPVVLADIKIHGFLDHEGWMGLRDPTAFPHHGLGMKLREEGALPHALGQPVTEVGCDPRSSDSSVLCCGNLAYDLFSHMRVEL